MRPAANNRLQDARPKEIRLAEARRRLAAAKKRAVYWCGAPKYDPRRSLLHKGRRSGPSVAQFQGAMDDVRTYTGIVAALTGRQPPAFDPRQWGDGDGQLVLRLDERERQ